MTNGRAGCTEGLRSRASKADTSVGNVQIRQEGRVVMMQQNRLTGEESVIIYISPELPFQPQRIHNADIL